MMNRSKFRITTIFSATANTQPSRRAGQKLQRKKALKHTWLEALEERQLLATTSFSSGLLTINLNAASEMVTLASNGTSLLVSSTSAITGAGALFAASGVTQLAVTDSGSLANQSFNFGAGSPFSFSGGVAVSNLEFVTVNSNVSVSGASSISITASNSIQTAGKLTTAGGTLTLSAASDIALTQPVVTNGGVQTLTADSDTDGSGTLSLNFALAPLVDPNPSQYNFFGDTILVLPSGNVVVTAPQDNNAGGSMAGAVYLFNGFTGEVITTLRGASDSDQLGSGGVTALTNGNYVICSPLCNINGLEGGGAVTWGSGISGVAGIVLSSNSLVGSVDGDQVGLAGIRALPTGQYLVFSPTWDNGSSTNAGAVTYCNGSTGTTGAITSSNSLVGSTQNTQIGVYEDPFTNIYSPAFTLLTNGNYVIASQYWSSATNVGVGAVTWCNGTTGRTGTITSSNSLVGTSDFDFVGSDTVVALSNGNYVVASHAWNNGATEMAGAVTWCNGTTGTTGTVSTSNSLYGTTDSDQVGSGGVVALSNGNYVVASDIWNNGASIQVGAVTWCNGSTGRTGAVSTSNSLYGTSDYDQVGAPPDPGLSSVKALTNGHYVVSSVYWDKEGQTDAGAVTWCDGTSGRTGPVTTSNSLYGTYIQDQVGMQITALTNGNYVVSSPFWTKGGERTMAGAATWCNGTTGRTGAVSTSNSLYGNTDSDFVGANVKALKNGNYVVISDTWTNTATGAASAGAVSFGNGTTGLTGLISSSNSLVGAQNYDSVGMNGVIELTNGNYVVGSNQWFNGASSVGAATWCSGTTGLTGNVTTSNSLVGTSDGDRVGYGINALGNGNYVVCSPYWNNSVGAATWANGTTGLVGTLSVANSIFGNAPGESGVWAASNQAGNTFFVRFWNDGYETIAAGLQSSGFASTSGSLNSGGASIALQASAVTVQATACTSTANSITVTANSLNISGNGTLNATGSGSVSIRTRGAGINLGNGTDTAGNLGISAAEFTNITAGTLTIGNSTTGAIVNTDAISRTGDLTLISGNAISQSGNGALTITGTANFVSSGNANFGNITLGNATNDFGTVTACGTNITLADSNDITLASITSPNGLFVNGSTSSSCITVTGPINAAGGSGGLTLTGRNIEVTGNISTGSGDIRLYGNGGDSYQSGSFEGVMINGASVNVNSTSGNITIDGRGGGGSTYAGVRVNFATISTGATGGISLTGLSGNSPFSSACGVSIGGGTLLTTDGPLAVNGTSIASGPNKRGVYISNFANLAATGQGSLAVNGTAANGDQNAFGIFVQNSNLSTQNGSLIIEGSSNGTMTSTNGLRFSGAFISAGGSGNLTLTGIATDGATNPYGIYVSTSTVLAANGTLAVNGTVLSAGSGSQGVVIDNTSNLSTTGSLASAVVTGATPGNLSGVGINVASGVIGSDGRPIVLNANSVNLNSLGLVNATNSGSVTIQTLGAGVNLGDGADTDANLGLSQSELNNITAGTLTIGNITTGAIVNTDAISRSGNLTLVSGNAISQSGAGNLIITGEANFVASGSGSSGNIVLGNATNNFNTVLACGTNITLTDANNITLGAITGNGTVQLTAQNLTLSSTLGATSSGTVILLPTSGTQVDLGTKSAGNFGLSQAELNNITAASLSIGDATSGNISITAPIAPSSANNLTLTTGSQIRLGANITMAGSLALSNATLLTGNANLTTTNSLIAFGSTLNGSYNLDLTAGSANISIGGAIGNTSPLNNLTINSANIIAPPATVQATNLFLNGGELQASTSLTTNLKVDGGTAKILAAGSLTGNANLVSGSLISANTITGTLSVNGGTANMQTGAVTTGLATLAGGSLTSNATFNGGLTATGGTLYTLHNGTSTTNLNFGAAAVWDANGSSLTDFGTITANGSVTIASGANLTLVVPVLTCGQSVTVLNKTSAGAASGSFSGLAQDTFFTSNGMPLAITYSGGSGNNDIVVTNTPRIMVIVGGNNQTAASGALFGQNLTVQVMGGAANETPVIGANVLFQLPVQVTNCNIASGYFNSVNDVANLSANVLTDNNGNATIAIRGGVNPGPFNIQPVMSDYRSLYNTFNLGVVGVAVQKQSINRSNVRYLDLVLTDPTAIPDLTALNSNIVLQKVKTASMTGGANITPVNLTLTATNAVKTTVGWMFDFGAAGIGGNGVDTTTNDGVYQFANATGSSSLPGAYQFHRLLGDTNGDKVVNAADTALVNSLITSTAWRYNNANTPIAQGSLFYVATNAWAGDANGDGRVNATDINITGRWRGRRVTY